MTDDMSPAELAARDRLHAGLRELAVARGRLELEAGECAKAFENFTAAWRASDLRDQMDEAEEVATHPDLVELDVTLDGWYA